MTGVTRRKEDDGSTTEGDPPAATVFRLSGPGRAFAASPSGRLWQ